MTEEGQMIKGSSRLGTVLGGTTAILGFLAIMAPMISGLAITVVVAALLVAAGIAMTVFFVSSNIRNYRLSQAINSTPD